MLYTLSPNLFALKHLVFFSLSPISISLYSLLLLLLLLLFTFLSLSPFQSHCLWPLRCRWSFSACSQSLLWLLMLVFHCLSCSPLRCCPAKSRGRRLHVSRLQCARTHACGLFECCAAVPFTLISAGGGWQAGRNAVRDGVDRGPTTASLPPYSIF